MKVKSDDSILYAGTMSGDIVKIKLNCCEEFDKSPVLVGCYGRHNPKKAFGKDCENYLNGIRDLILVSDEKQFLIGAGDGVVELVEERDVKIKEYPSPIWPKLKAVGISVELNFSSSQLRLCLCFSAQTKKSEWLHHIIMPIFGPYCFHWNRIMWNIYVGLSFIYTQIADNLP